MKDVMISARIPEELSEQITMLAQALKRNRTWVIEEALRGYIATERQFLDAVEEGIQDMKVGRVVSHDAVVSDLTDLLAAYPDGKA